MTHQPFCIESRKAATYSYDTPGSQRRIGVNRRRAKKGRRNYSFKTNESCVSSARNGVATLQAGNSSRRFDASSARKRNAAAQLTRERFMPRRSLLALVVVLACTATDAYAATISGQSPALTPLLPARGAYFDSSKSGTGVAVDVGLSGFVFLTYYGYDTLGAPTWYSIQGQWSPTSEAERITTGKIGKLNSPLLFATGGQCITCNYTGGPILTIAPYPVSVSWTQPRHLQLTIANQNWHMDAVQYAVTDDRLLAGRWSMTLSWDGGDQINSVNGGVAARTEIVDISPLGSLVTHPPVATFVDRDPNADPSIALPPDGSLSSTIRPSFLQQIIVGSSGPAFDDVFTAIAPSTAYIGGRQSIEPLLWYDPVSHRAGLDFITHQGAIDTNTLVFGPNNIHFDLYFDQDRIVGHGVAQGANLMNVPAGYWQPSTVSLNLLLERLPAGIVEHCILRCP